MKIVHLTYSDMGGAGIAAKQLHLALLNNGISSKLVTLIALGEKTKEHYIFQPKQSNLLKKIYNRVTAIINYRLPFLSKHNKGYLLKNQKEGFEMFSFPFSNLDIQDDELIQNADIIHLHWVSDGMIDYRFFFKNIKKPIVWTLHDMNPFTGGCHQSDGCEKFTKTCNSCFQLDGTHNEYLSKEILKYKIKGLQAIKTDQLKILTPSQWLGNLSKKSKCFSRFEHFQIPNIINFPISNITKAEARLFFNIKEDEHVLLFVANTTNNNRKGIDVLIKALEDIKAKEKTRLLIIGKNSPGLINDISNIELGFVTDKTILKNAYIASDVFLLPSIAENFPNTIVESLLCGTPVIASKVGGIVEQIHSENGMLVPVKDVKEWTNAINSFFENQKKFNSQIISAKAFEKYNHQIILEQHLNVYNHITS